MNIKITAILNLARTIFVCIILSVGALFFSKDANDIALRPIEKMIENICFISKNPLNAKNLEIIADNKSNLETTIIYNSIIKIGILK